MPRVARTGGVAVAGRVVLPQTENFVVGNRDLSNAANWTPNGATPVTGFADPTGGVQAAELTEIVGVSAHTIFTPPAGQSIPTQVFWACVSTYFQAGSRSFGGFVLDMSTSTVVALWDLNTGANTLLTTSNILESFTETLVLPGVGGGWGRYSVSFLSPGGNPASSNPAFVLQLAMSPDGTTTVYNGVAGRTLRAYAPSLTFANRAGPVTDTTAGAITTRFRNRARNRVAP